MTNSNRVLRISKIAKHISEKYSVSLALDATMAALESDETYAAMLRLDPDAGVYLDGSLPKLQDLVNNWFTTHTQRPIKIYERSARVRTFARAEDACDELKYAVLDYIREGNGADVCLDLRFEVIAHVERGGE